MNPPQRQRLAIIGCGPSAMSTLITFAKAEQQQQQMIPEIVCLEKQNSMGGQWIYTWRTSVDEYGVPVPNSMYRDMRLNAPKEIDETYDYTFDDHFGSRPVHSYCSRDLMLEYLLGRAKKYDIERFVKFRTLVRNVKQVKEDCFQVQYEDLQTGQISTETFNYVVVACGMFSTPNLPAFPGLETFPGRIFHSHSFRQTEELLSVKKLLIVGTSFSAIDIACFHYRGGKGNTTTMLSYRKENPKLPLNWPAGSVITVPDLVTVSGRVCHFKDGSQHDDVDMIIFATGYKFDFRFLEMGLRLQGANSLMYDSLYKGVFHQANPNLMYVGMMRPIIAFPVYDRQAWLVKEFVTGRLTALPSVEDRQKDIDKWMKRLMSIQTALSQTVSMALSFILDYMNDLVKVCILKSFLLLLFKNCAFLVMLPVIYESFSKPPCLIFIPLNFILRIERSFHYFCRNLKILL